MSISYKSPPAASLKELNRAMGQTGAGAAGLAGMPQIPHIEPGEVMRFKPHRIYVSHFADAADGKAVRNAKLAVWRYLMTNAGGLKFSIEVNFDRSKKHHQFGRLNIGQRTANMHALLETAEKDGLELPKGRDYKVRGLRIPSLHLEAAWFHSTSGHDLIIPLAPWRLGGNLTDTAFTVKAFESLLAEKANLFHG